MNMFQQPSISSPISPCLSTNQIIQSQSPPLQGQFSLQITLLTCPDSGPANLTDRNWRNSKTSLGLGLCSTGRSKNKKRRKILPKMIHIFKFNNHGNIMYHNISEVKIFQEYFFIFFGHPSSSAVYHLNIDSS